MSERIAQCYDLVLSMGTGEETEDDHQQKEAPAAPQHGGSVLASSDEGSTRASGLPVGNKLNDPPPLAEMDASLPPSQVRLSQVYSRHRVRLGMVDCNLNNTMEPPLSATLITTTMGLPIMGPCLRADQ